MLIHIIVGVTYAIVLAPIAYLLARTLAVLSRHTKRREIFEGIAVSSLIAVCAALLLTSGVGVRGGILVWVAYVAATGVTIWLPEPVRLRDVVACAVAPSLVLLASLLAVYFLPLWLGQTAGSIVSADRSLSVAGSNATQALLLTLFVSVVSVLGTAVGVYARAGVVRLVKQLFALNPTAFSNVEKSVNTCLRIGAAVFALFAVSRT